MRTIARRSAALAVGVMLIAPLASVVGAQEPTSEDRVDPRADRILRQMGEYLQTAEEILLRAEVAYDRVRATGQKALFGGQVEVSLQRPDRLHAYYRGDRRHNRAIFSDGTFTFVNVEEALYARMETPADLDRALDEAFDAVGFSVPVADFFYADPYGVLIEGVRSGRVVGRHDVAGVPCHHLAFTQDAIDWQIWIEDGPRPVPRRLVITYKNEFGEPQYTATFLEWNFQPRLSSSHFEFDPPSGAAEVEFLPSP